MVPAVASAAAWHKSVADGNLDGGLRTYDTSSFPLITHGMGEQENRTHAYDNLMDLVEDRMYVDSL